MSANNRKLPKTPNIAEQQGYQKVDNIYHDALSAAEKKKWVMVQPAAASRRQTVCHYNPNTGNWDDCRELPEDE